MRDSKQFKKGDLVSGKKWDGTYFIGVYEFECDNGEHQISIGGKSYCVHSKDCHLATAEEADQIVAEERWEIASAKGHHAENIYVSYFQKLGFTQCANSALVNEAYDRAKIDLVGIPFNIQIKTGKQPQMHPCRVLFEMDACIKTDFKKSNPDYRKPRLLLRRLNVKGKTRQPESELIYMSKKQFDKFKAKNPNLEYLSINENAYYTQSEYKTIVCMTLKYFTEEVILKLYVNS